MTPVALLVVHNLLTNLWFSDRWYVRVNLTTTVAVLAVAGGCRALRVTGPGVAAGAAGALVVLVVLGCAATWPGTRALLADRRMAAVDGWGTAWRALVRIPLGTVVLEEVAFRGVLPGVVSPVGAAALFGGWHVLPTIRALDANGLPRSPAVVAGAVAATAGVGLVFSGLVAATGSLVAPALVHVASNSGATVLAYRTLRPRPAGGRSGRHRPWRPGSPGGRPGTP